MPGARAATASARPDGRGDRRVGVATRPDVGDGDAVGLGEDVGEVVEQGRGPVVGQRLVDGPHPAPRLALADGGERLADRRRVVAVVVVDHDAPRLALPLEAAPDAGERREAGQHRLGRHADGDRRRPARRARWTRCGGPPWRAGRGAPDRRRPPAGPCRRGPRPRSAPRSAVAGPSAVRNRSGSAATSTAVTTSRPGQVARRPRSTATPSSATFATRTGGVPSAPRSAAAARIQRSNAASTASRSANTSGWSHSAEVSTITSGRYGSKLPAYSSASTTNASPAPRRAVAGTPIPVNVAGRSAPTNAPGSAPAATSAWTSQPDVVHLPWVPATATRRRPARRVRDELLPRLERDARRRARRPARGGRGRSP